MRCVDVGIASRGNDVGEEAVGRESEATMSASH